MRSQYNINEILDVGYWKKVADVASSETDNFVELAAKYALDPQTDFRYADLRCVDFSGCDLRGYDFSGADLRGALGRNVVWDRRTRFDDASVSGSIFAYDVARRDLFANRPDLQRRLRKLLSEDQTLAVAMMAESLKPSAKNREDSIEVARAVFDETRNSFVRSQVLYFLRPTFEDAQEHFDYLIHALAKSANDERSVLMIVRAIGLFHKKNELAIRALAQIVGQGQDGEAVITAAFQAILTSRFFAKYAPDPIAHAEKYNGNMRRIYARRHAARLGAEYAQAILEPYTDRTIDYEDPISPEILEKLASSDLNRQHLARSRGMQNATPTVYTAQARHVAEHQLEIVRRIQRIISAGVPFRFDFDVEALTQRLSTEIKNAKASARSWEGARILPSLVPEDRL